MEPIIHEKDSRRLLVLFFKSAVALRLVTRSDLITAEYVDLPWEGSTWKGNN